METRVKKKFLTPAVPNLRSEEASRLRKKTLYIQVFFAKINEGYFPFQFSGGEVKEGLNTLVKLPIASVVQYTVSTAIYARLR